MADSVDEDTEADSADHRASESPPNPSPTTAAMQLLDRIRDGASPDSFLSPLADASNDELAVIQTDRRAGLAFWLNVYNAATQLLLERRPDLFNSRLRFFRAHAITVGGVSLSLDDIEHGILRGGRSKYWLGYLPRLEPTGLGRSYRLEIDPRVHFALNCGAASCPAVRTYDFETIDETLDLATRSYLDETVAYDANRDRVRVPRLCLWFIGDFGGRSGLRQFLRTFKQIPARSSPSLRFHGYDWTKEARKFADTDRTK